jgi:hypothetical protein
MRAMWWPPGGHVAVLWRACGGLQAASWLPARARLRGGLFHLWHVGTDFAAAADPRVSNSSATRQPQRTARGSSS